MQSGRRIALGCISLATLLLFDSAAAQETIEQILTAECTTKATGGDGTRSACDSERSQIRAPANYVFVQNSLSGGEVSGNGSEHECLFGWDRFVEVIKGTGITQPTVFWIQAHARSPKGHFSGRGWAHCKYTVKLTRYN